MATNTALVMRHIQAIGPSTSRDIVQATGLSMKEAHSALNSLLRSGKLETMEDRVPAKWSCKGLQVFRLAQPKKAQEKCCVWELLPYQKKELVAEADAFIAKLRNEPRDPFTLMRMHLGG